MAGKEILRLENVSFSYGEKGRQALSGISLSFFQGEFVGIIGPVGSGKTTLLCCCNGLVPKEMRGSFSGKVLLDGRDLAHMGFNEISRAVSMVFQDPNDQIFNLTVEEEVAFGLQNQGVPRKQALFAAHKALQSVGMAGRALDDPAELSSGQKQKVAIACALCANSSIMLLDEPVSSLDWRSCQEVYAILDRLVKQGKTVILTEQDTGLLAEHAGRIIVIDKGKAIADGGRDIIASSKLEKLGLRVPSVVRLARELGIKGGYSQVKEKLERLISGGKKRG
jgi:energy-coupling factor transport system ATP-binding protein